MKSSEAAEAAEVQHIQSEDVAHAMHVHGSRQACIVYLNTLHGVLYHDTSLLSINGFTIW